jgi:hypothetical protein
LRTVSTLCTTLMILFVLLGSAQNSSASVTVNVTSPTNVGTSFTLQASASSSSIVTGWVVYVDGNDAWTTPGPTSNISAPLSVGTGSHAVAVRAWDSAGAFGTAYVTLNASASNPAPSIGGVTVSVQSPGNGSTPGSPVTFQASATSPNGIAGWVIYVDNNNAYQVDNYSNSLSASVAIAGGNHTVYIRAWDRVSGFGTSPSLSINVNGNSSSSTSGSSVSSGALPTPPSSANVFSDINQSTSNWSSCSDCAGGTYTSNYWKSFWQGSPSMDGASLQFYNGGGSWADVLWIKKLGQQSWATNFLWDFYVYYDSTTAANLWSAEFDLWQSVGGYEYMIGTQCAFGDGVWDTWNQSAGHWIQTSIPCSRFSPGSWHHIQWYMQRLSGNRYKYVTLVVDDKAYDVNQTYYANWAGWDDDLGIQFQLDLNGNGTDAHEWVDKVKLSVW